MTNNQLPEETQSFWMETGKRNKYSELEKNLDIDTVVIGGGIAGILTMYSLTKQGKDVALLEGRELLSGTTGYTTAKLSAQHQLIYDELINRYGEEHAQLFYQSNIEGIAYIKEIIEEHQISCQINEQNAFVYTQDPAQKENIKKEAEAYNKLNIPGRYLSELPLDIDVEAAIQMDHQAEIQPVSFLHGVLEAVKQTNGHIYEHSLVNELTQNEDKTIHLKTSNGCEVTCNNAIFTTHYPTFEPDKFFTQMKPEISYALAYKTNKEYLDGMYINNDKPKRTFRKMSDGQDHYLLVGGQSHSIGDEHSEMSRYEEIDQFAKRTFGVGQASYRWSSHDLLTKDRIPFIGQLHPDYPNIYTATGFNKWGLAEAATAARVLTDFIFNKQNRYTDMYHPRRNIPKLTEPSEKSSEPNDAKELIIPETAEDIGINEAAVIKTEDEHTGIYKDKKGKLHYLDLSCTHLGCGLSWNNGDKTWDCPCHGSRFNAIGEVIEGPALIDLKQK